jgi:hypothetical protein
VLRSFLQGGGGILRVKFSIPEAMSLLREIFRRPLLILWEARIREGLL